MNGMSLNLLRDVNGAYHGGAEHLFLSIHEILEEVDRHVVIGRKKHADICGEEVINLALALVLGREFLG